jgi:hypothetical protein
MTRRTLAFFLTLVLAITAAPSALAGEQDALATPSVAPAAPTVSSPTTQPSKVAQGFRYLDHGSWIVTEAQVRTNGTPAVIKRKTLVTTLPGTGQRGVEESRWTMDTFEPTGPVQPLAAPDRRSFDDLNFTPTATLPDEPLTIARKRYLCSVATYTFKSDAGDRTTTLTLWRDKSGGTQLPPRTIPVNNKDVPLPPDALQADFTVEAPGVSTRGERRIVALAKPMRVNAQTCSCLVESTQQQGTSHDKPMSLTLQEWFCHDLPGERMRTVTSMTVGPHRVDSDVRVTDFHVARQTADSTATNAAGR